MVYYFLLSRLSWDNINWVPVRLESWGNRINSFIRSKSSFKTAVLCLKLLTPGTLGRVWPLDWKLRLDFTAMLRE